MNSFNRSWIFTKNSWRVLRMDKEMLWYPLLNVLAGVFLLLVFLGGGFALNIFTFVSAPSGEMSSQRLPELLWGLGFVITTILAANYYTGALIAAAIKRFEGGDPTVKYGLGEARKRFWSIAAFSAFSGSVGYLLQLIQQRVPFGGKIIAFLADVAWNVANVFSLPVIMTTDGYIGPIDAMKQSVGIIRKTWREAAVTNFGVGIVSLFVVLAYLALGGAAIALAVTVNYWLLNVVVIAGVGIGFFIVMAGITALGGIIKAAIYHYAVTGKAPEQFDRELMEAAFTPKKARKIFG